MSLPKEIQNLSEIMNFLPGIGPKMANRIALYLSVSGKNLAKRLSDSINEVSSKITQCKRCNNITTSHLCEICTNDMRDNSILIVVEDSLDLYNIESTGVFNGVYHVLGGLISPVNGIGPSDLSLDKLISRLRDEKIKEIILALNSNLEGDSTSMYIRERIETNGLDVTVTKLAKGLPSGGEIEYASSQTLIDSLKSRSGF